MVEEEAFLEPQKLFRRDPSLEVTDVEINSQASLVLFFRKIPREEDQNGLISCV